MPSKADEFIAAARVRLAADGNDLSHYATLYGPALAARQHARRMLGYVDLTTVILPVPHATAEIVKGFVHDLARAARRAPTSSYMGTAVTALPIIVSEDVTPEAREVALARKPFKVGVRRYNSGTFVWPAVVDLKVGERLFYAGSFWIGRFGSDWVLARLVVALGPRDDLPIDR